MGCTAMYIAFVLTFIVDMLLLRLYEMITIPSRFVIGMIFFIPGLIQLFWKSSNRYLRYLMRSSLGISIWFLLSFVLFTQVIYLQIGGVIIFSIVVFLVSKIENNKKLDTCGSCKYNQSFDTCLIRHQDLLHIEGLEQLIDEDEYINKIIALKFRAKHSDAIILPSEEIK